MATEATLLSLAEDQGAATTWDGNVKITRNGSTQMVLTDTSGAHLLGNLLDGSGSIAVAGSITIGDGQNIGSVSDPDAISISTGGNVTFTQSILMANGKSLGQAAGPLLTFDDTNNFLEITGCFLGLGTTTPLALLHAQSGGSGATPAASTIATFQATSGTGTTARVEIIAGATGATTGSAILGFGDFDTAGKWRLALNNTDDSFTFANRFGARLTLNDLATSFFSGSLGVGLDPTYKFSVGSADNSDQVGIYHDNLNAFITWDDGSLILKTDEGTNTQTFVDIMGKGTSYGTLRLYDQDEAEYLSISCFSGQGFIDTVGASPSHISMQNTAHAGVRMFENAASGETQELSVYGFRAADSLRSLQIGVGIDAADTASFDGLSNYLFDGNLQVNGGNIGLTADTNLIAMASGALTVNGTLYTTGALSVGIASGDGTCHIHTGSAGAVTANTVADNLVVEHNDTGGISILTPDNKAGRLVFGTPSDNVGASFLWN